MNGLLRRQLVPVLLLLLWSPLSVSRGQTARLEEAPVSAITAPSPAVLAPGDSIHIAVWRRAEFTGDFVVTADGTIAHPLYREVKVAGIPLPAVEDRIRTFLLKYEANPAFVFSPFHRIFVGGEVRSPGVHSVPPGTTIAQAIALSGGPTDNGKLTRVRVTRNNRTSTLDLVRADEAVARAETRSGDVILVGRRRSVFRDVIAPASTLATLVVAVTGIVIQLRR